MAEAPIRAAEGSLTGLQVLVTRPRHQAAGLVARIEALGGTAIRFPVIEILPAAQPERAAEAMQSLEAVGTAIFVSPNAVEHGLALLGRALLRDRPDPDQVAEAKEHLERATALGHASTPSSLAGVHLEESP